MLWVRKKLDVVINVCYGEPSVLGKVYYGVYYGRSGKLIMIGKESESQMCKELRVRFV